MAMADYFLMFAAVILSRAMGVVSPNIRGLL
jgi:hypothetical protein